MDAGAICPNDGLKIFVVGLPVGINVSPGQLQWDVTPESAIIDGIFAVVACILSLWSDKLCVVFLCWSLCDGCVPGLQITW